MKEHTFCSTLAPRRSSGRTGSGSVPCPEVLQRLPSRVRLTLLLLLLWRMLLQVKPLFLPFSLCYHHILTVQTGEQGGGVTTVTQSREISPPWGTKEVPSPPVTPTIAHTLLRQALDGTRHLQSGWCVESLDPFPK